MPDKNHVIETGLQKQEVTRASLHNLVLSDVISISFSGTDLRDFPLTNILSDSPKPRLLDLFCGAGGASMGYYRAGFDVVGVDIKPQPHYPFEFIQADAMTFPLDEFDVIHASPPCQGYSATKSLHKKEHPMLIEDVRKKLKASKLPYVIENVEGAPLQNTLMLCGTMFGLKVYRHRIFECNPSLWFPPATCAHRVAMAPSKGTYHTLEKYGFITCVGHNFQAASGRKAMQIDWMTRDEMAQSIPPAFCEFIGKQLLEALK